MSDATGTTGRAWRAYQILGILALGWAVGRMPTLLKDGWPADGATFLQSADTERETPLAEPAVQGVSFDPEVQGRMVAEVAARVAQETVAQLLAAGWGPGNLPARPVSGRPHEVVIRTVAEPAHGAPVFSLPLRAPEDVAVRPADAPQPEISAGTSSGQNVDPRRQRAHALATDGYAAVRSGDRRRGAALLKEAVRTDPSAPEAVHWQADGARLRKRWSIAGYSVMREGTGTAMAASPVLGGGQTAFAVGYKLDPYARRPVSIIGRMSAASGARRGVDTATSEAALGLRYQPFGGVSLDVERRFALGTYARNAWSARLSAGHHGQTEVLGRKVQIEGYAEGGVVGFSSPDFYGGAQGRGAVDLATVGRVHIDGGVGLWGSAQQTFGQTATRFDAGPSARFRLEPWPVSAQVDYRVKMAGNAQPGSGPVFTVVGEF